MSHSHAPRVAVLQPMQGFGCVLAGASAADSSKFINANYPYFALLLLFLRSLQRNVLQPQKWNVVVVWLLSICSVLSALAPPCKTIVVRRLSLHAPPHLPDERFLLVRRHTIFYDPRPRPLGQSTLCTPQVIAQQLWPR